MTPPDPPQLDRLGSLPRRSVLKRGLQDPATAQPSSSPSSAQRVRFQCPSPPVEVRSYKKLMKDHLQFSGVTVCDGRYCRHSVLAGAGEGLFPWDENGELLGNLNRYEIFCDECQRDMEEKLWHWNLHAHASTPRCLTVVVAVVERVSTAVVSSSSGCSSSSSS